MEPIHQISQFLLDLINFLVLLSQLSGDLVGLLEDLALLLSAVSKSLGKLDVLGLHRLKKN
jgi:hypothetical protein